MEPEISTESKPTTFWMYDYSVLFQDWHSFYPTFDMSTTEQMNALSRFAIYTTVLISALHRSWEYMPYLAFALCVVYVAYHHQVVNHRGTKGAEETTNREIKHVAPKEGVMIAFVEGDVNREEQQPGRRHNNSNSPTATAEERCIRPTPNNPFMNRAVGDVHQADLPSCSNLGEQSDNMWRDGLFQNVDDVYNRHLSSRQFYTMPNNKVPNDQTAFAQALYGDEARGRENGTCKQNRRVCFEHAYF